MRKLIALLVIIGGIIALFFLTLSRTPDMLASSLSRKLGVAVSIDAVHFAPREIEIEKIEIGNPKGYSLSKAFSAQKIAIDAPINRYFSRSIEVEKVEVDDIYLGIEFDSKSSTDGNWRKIFYHLKTSSTLDRADGKQVKIKLMTFNNIKTEVMFRDGGGIQTLPPIDQIVLKDIDTEGGLPIDQLTASVLGQMLREIFIQQHLENMLKGLLLDTPGKAADRFFEPFKGFFNTIEDDSENAHHRITV